ncbi:hypothetical protein GQ457_03G019850 [Hibiscus cannabinus]
MFLVFFMNIKNINLEPPRTTTGHQQPATTPSLRPPSPCSGHRLWWSDPLKILFFRDPIPKPWLPNTQPRSKNLDLQERYHSSATHQKVEIPSTLDGTDGDTWQREMKGHYLVGCVLDRWIRSYPTVENVPRGSMEMKGHPQLQSKPLDQDLILRSSFGCAQKKRSD